MDKKADFFQKKFSNTRSFTRQKETSRVWIWIVVVLFILVWWLVLWKIFWAPANLNGYELENDHNIDFSLWEEVYLEWEIKSDGDIITHTHTINDVNYWVIWIKSDSINLSDYAGFVELTGIVEKFYQWNPIVKVRQLSGTISNVEDDTNIVLDGNAWVYFKGAWIQFLPNFFDEYVLLNEWENGEIRIQNIESWEEFKLNYFRCNPSDPNRNCKGLNEVFANNNAQSFVTSEWDVYYKQSEIQSWFVSNGNRWGIFIDNVPDDVIFELKDLIKFANEKNMNEWIKSRAMKICQSNEEKLQKINNSEISLKQEWLIVTVSGDGMEKQMTCQILVDFSLPAKWELQSLTIWDDVVVSEEPEEIKEDETKTEEVIQEENKEEPAISATAFDINVPQFPIKEEWLQYKSARGGYVLKFPSSNISYSVSSVKENFGRDDVKCSYVINVIKYSEKENLEISPAVRIYECEWSVDQSWAQGIVVYPRLDKKFVVQMNDGAWYDFSTHLNFEEFLTEE
jgi:hypothetical protein